MPPPGTVEQYVELMGKSGLVSEARLSQTIYKIAARPSPPASLDEFSKACVEEGLLSTFQSKQIRLGRYKKFILNGKYKILELIGTGGMGAVYLCEHVFMRRLVAVKILPADKYDDPSNLERFIREARAVAALNHPNIVRAYDIDKADGIHFLVMEYVDGSSLQEIVARFGPLDPVRAAHCIAQAAVGLQHAYEQGLVHRDIKPGNMLIDRTGVVKLLDLGLARFSEAERNDQLTERFDEKCVLGTADYLAPEQAIHNSVDIRADIYGLGGTLYFLLTGRSPVPEGNVAQKLLFHQKSEAVPVTNFRKDVPQGILTVLATMLKKNPDHRFQTPLDVATALAEWAEQPLQAPHDYEMPALCPAVTSLVGHSIDRPRLSGAVSSSGAIRFVVPKSKVSLAAKSSSAVAVATAPASSTVDFRTPHHEQGSTIPISAAMSPTAAISIPESEFSIHEPNAALGVVPSENELFEREFAASPSHRIITAPVGHSQIVSLPNDPSRKGLWVVVAMLAFAVAALCIALIVGR
jgi:serine/threonine protein kinase